LIMMVVKAIIEGIDHRLHAIMETDEYNTLEKLILITCAFPDAKDIDYHKAMFIRDEFPKQYDMFLHYIEDNWSVSKALFNQCIQEGYIRSVDHDVFKVIILGITKQVLSMDDTDQELLLEKSVRMVFDGLVIR